MKFYSAEQYQTSCDERFRRYEHKVKNLLPQARVEHVGASSIPLAISKGELDIFIGVESDELNAAIQLLTTLGFQEKADTLRTSELCMLESTSGDDVAFQLVANGSEFEFFLIFRDKLRAAPSLVHSKCLVKASHKMTIAGKNPIL